ncbi:MAG: hypothetical protein KC413_25280, partial [Anaerolineales bacterium]|nr:hypothetical protein [Anaerolineales bacterium]
QERALKLIASKIAAAVRVNGDTVEADSLADMDEYASADIVTALSKMLMEEIDFTEEMKEVNKAYEEALAGNLTYSHKYTFAGTGYDKGAIRKRYAAYAKKVHPDVAEQPDRKVESLNDIFAKANAAFQADDQFVGDFKIEDDFVPEPEPATAEPPPVQEPPKPVMRRMTLGSMTFGEAAQLFERKKRRARPVSELQMSLFG